MNVSRLFTFIGFTTVVVTGILGCAGIASAQPTVKVLHSLSLTVQAGASVIQATDGNFYGTTRSGGATGFGTVFKITPAGAFTVLHTFTGWPTDGADPAAALIQGTDGNFYGTTQLGGASGVGTVFKMTPDGTVTLLHHFNGGADRPSWSAPALIEGTDGNFYGTTGQGFYVGMGTVFKISPAGVFTVLYAFAGGTSDGANPAGRLIQGSDGNFYGTTRRGGATDSGTVFRMTPAGTVTVLHSFSADGDTVRRPV